MRLLVFSDGHIGEYPEGWIDPITGVNTRLSNTLDVWSWVLEEARERKVDAVVFGGDRFKPHRPPAWMRDYADERIADFRDSGIPLVLLKGNHDMLDKAGRWHSYGGVYAWRANVKIYVCDKPNILDFNGVNLYMLPFGHTEVDYGLLPSGVNLLVFHDEVTSVSRYNGQVAKGGIPRNMIDREAWALVLGGHIHERQELPFKNTTAFHIGTPLERVEDLDKQSKGAILINVSNSGEIELEHLESPFPKVHRKCFSWSGSVDEILHQVLFDPDFAVESESILVATVNHDGTMTTKDRRNIILGCRDSKIAGVSIKMNRIGLEQKMVTLDPSFSKATLGEQMIAWARLNQENEEVLNTIGKIVGGSK